jgi:hypothetical protein
MPSTTQEIHAWVRGSFYRTGAVVAGFVALLVASTPAPLEIVPVVFLSTLPFALAAAYAVDWFQGNLGSDATPEADRGSQFHSQSVGPGARDRTVAGTEADAALQRLRERYANGELSDEAFERRIERLLETAELRDLVVEAAKQRSEGTETPVGDAPAPDAAAGSTIDGAGTDAGRDGWFDDLGNGNGNGNAAGSEAGDRTAKDSVRSTEADRDRALDTN